MFSIFKIYNFITKQNNSDNLILPINEIDKKICLNNINSALKMIELGINTYNNNFIHNNLKIAQKSISIVLQNKGNLINISDDIYLYNSYSNISYIIWNASYRIGWKPIKLQTDNINYKTEIWDIESQCFINTNNEIYEIDKNSYVIEIN